MRGFVGRSHAMAIDSHIDALHKKHTLLNDQIRLSFNGFTVDDARLYQLKRKKLFLKQEIDFCTELMKKSSMTRDPKKESLK